MVVLKFQFQFWPVDTAIKLLGKTLGNPLKMRSGVSLIKLVKEAHKSLTAAEAYKKKVYHNTVWRVGE